ncbi:MAG: TonB family protein [Candidatus Rokubacteria bacterium]|nr:TonB family protein [Candidatus Rokubacteria bacterium]
MGPWRRRPGPALRGGTLPMRGMTASVAGHVLALVLAFLAGIWSEPRAKVYVVNLVAGLPSPRPEPSSAVRAQPVAAPPKAPPAVPRTPQLPPRPAEARPAELPPRPADVARPPDLPPRRAEVVRPGELEPVHLPDPKLPPARRAEVVRPAELPPPTLARPEERKPVLPPRVAELPRAREVPPLAPRREAKDQPAERPAPPRVSPLPASESTSRPAEAPPARSLVAGQGKATVSADSDFPFAWYLRQVLSKVEEEWAKRPPISDPPQRPIIFVEILRNGSINQPRLEKKSGNEFYDQAALRAIINASPFPRLPDEWNRPTLRIQFGFELQSGRG